MTELEKITVALGKTFPGLCEVVLHDLRDPSNTIRTIENNISGRTPGQPATEIGLARIQDPDFPEVLQNYANRFPDGRAAKSTSIGIKDQEGNYIAALCLNVDVSMLNTIVHQLSTLTRTEDQARPVEENLKQKSLDEIRDYITQYAAQRGVIPQALDQESGRALTQKLRDEGYMNIRKFVPTVSETLGISRATVYNYLK
ncbi:helix-turn-helix transcriptional regulator [Kocuria sp. U4B]